MASPTPHPVEITDRFAVSTRTLSDAASALDRASTVLDMGCAGWKIPELAASLGRDDLYHIGADLYGEPAGWPNGARFMQVPGDCAVFSGPVADLVVCSHCLEHSALPVALFGALVAACKPGGLLYLESPSELSALAVAGSDPRDHAFGSFWDDPRQAVDAGRLLSTGNRLWRRSAAVRSA